MNITNKRIIITGATSGIGAELLSQLRKDASIKIVACGRNTSKIEESPNVFIFKADISFPKQVDSLFEFAIEKMGGIDIFFANAGFAYYEKYSSFSWEHIQNIYSTNVTSPLYSLSKMLHYNKTNNFSVVITCSTISRLPFPGFSLYTGTKFSLDGFSRAVRGELPKNCHLMMVYPVATYTSFFDRASQNSNMPWPYQTTKDVVSAVLKGLKHNKKEVFPFKIIPLILYILNLFPFIRTIYTHLQNRKLNKLIDKN